MTKSFETKVLIDALRTAYSYMPTDDEIAKNSDKADNKITADDVKKVRSVLKEYEAHVDS